MHYYRYRSGSEVSFKELLYNELFFGSPEECNDPYDSKTFYEFPQDRVRWRRLLDQALHIDDEIFKSYLLDDLSEQICLRPPISLEELMTEHFLNLPPLDKRLQVQTLINMENAIRQFIGIYIPATRYFACFSSTDSNTLMWSHYANNHKGFCLIFKAINNKLKQDKNLSQKQIRRNTPHGLAQQTSYGIPEEFDFHKIGYRQHVVPVNAFECLSQNIFGEEVPDTEKNRLRQAQNSHFSQKESSWQYEKESRLILEPPPSWLFGEHIAYTSHERLFHYQPTQLVGIIMGAKMTSQDKDRLIEIIHEKNELIHRVSVPPYILFDFVTFEARLSPNQRSIEIHPTAILGGMPLKFGEKGFDDRLKRWQEGWGLEFDQKNSCKKIQVS